nr:glycogen debranching enzyme-like [Ciona intestinalis]|eukprot:XP_002130821.1 glycogen debranching enzyme-like [Ciona intestinalis]
MASTSNNSVDQIRILKLVDGKHCENTLYRLQKGWTIRFMLGPDLASQKVTVYTNIPPSEQPFKRTVYYPLSWELLTKSGINSLDAYAPVKLSHSGAFQYYFTYNDKKAGSGYFIVDPTLCIGMDNHVLPLDAVCMQTLLPKSLGQFCDWKDRLLVAKESGYNVLHFTPIQKLGCSNSSYSVSDQMAVNPSFYSSVPVTFNDVENLVEEIRRDWEMLSVTDVVWNHTDKHSSWLKTYPESAYNLHNSPYLRPAYILDRAIFHLTLDIEKGKKYASYFPLSIIETEKDLESLKVILLKNVLPGLKLWEFYQVDVPKQVEHFTQAVKSFKQNGNVTKDVKIKIIQDPNFNRLQCSVDIQAAVEQFYAGSDCDLDRAVSSFVSTLEWLNRVKKETVMSDLFSAVNNIIAGVRYERLAADGPKVVLLNKQHPLTTMYFHHQFEDSTVDEEEQFVFGDTKNSKFIMAHNGWVMGANALENFAEYPGKVYFRRELVCWGDIVKLRYGSSPSDCPPLWERMKQYTEMTARIFHGIRIDNCHSTPIHVAEYMLDAARKIRPDVYVFAELFTGSEEVDNIFVNRLGLTSLIREALNAWDAHELGRLVYTYGGEAISSFIQPATQILQPSRAHALFYDITHDNESVIVKRSIRDVLPFSALVSMSCCAIGSNRGHDEMTPHHINVVNEKRKYRKWNSALNSGSEFVGIKSGMIQGKHLLNVLHQTMAMNGFTQIFVDQRTQDVVAVTRHNPQTHYSYILVGNTSFSDSKMKPVPPMLVEGSIMGIPLEAKPSETEQSTQDYLKGFTKDKQFINGIDNYNLVVDTDIAASNSTCCKILESEDKSSQTVHFTHFPPGSIVVLRVKVTETVNKSISDIRETIASLHNSNTHFDKLVSKLNLRTLNRVLFRCNEEEMSDGFGISAYQIPSWQKLCYCGIAGIAIPLKKISFSNDLGHPICSNLREGNWLMDYISSRLLKHPDTKDVGNLYADWFSILQKLPRYLIPMYFELIISLTYQKLLHACWKNMSSFVAEGSSFVKSLSLGTVALCGVVKGAALPRVHPDVPGVCSTSVDKDVQDCSSISAGLPHFSSGVMRCWGRDTFIAMHGLQLVTGQYDDARNIILSFAGCLRHGLIPNLLGEGKISRYNCRDAVWFWLQCIQDYCEAKGFELLGMPVARIFPEHDSEPTPVGAKSQPLSDIIQEAMQRHVDGISFRERNAGSGIDSNMSDEGFLVEVGVDKTTGFVFGGSKFNCGTWCDKMGESEKAGTRGVPATPRDGSAVELVGLCKSTVRWLEAAHNSGKYAYDGVFIKTCDGSVNKLTWAKWNEQIAKNFEKYFYVGDEDTSHLVHKRYIYKDTHGASYSWCDYQLRPNFPIAMVYAPELFDAEHAWKALQIIQDKLLGPLGVKTLDPDDMQYRGDYDNSNDSDDKSIAKGFNYHQGPEWLWPVGYFLRAKLYFAKKLGSKKLEETIRFIRSYTVNHQLHLENSQWCGLPELTNSNGSHCHDSCPIQAWSHATLLDLLYDMKDL